MDVKKVCVITGGGSGMGLATAKIMGKTHHIIISGRTVSKLQNAVQELKTEGISVEACACDVSNRNSVKELAVLANGIGEVTAVIHAAGLSPHMDTGETIMRVNALGTINVNEVFAEVMGEKSCILDVSSMSAYMLPAETIPTALFPLSYDNQELFISKVIEVVNKFPENMHPAVAYGISKNFVNWRARQDAGRLGEKGIRVVSVSPGNFETPMGELESVDGNKYIQLSAIKRFGKPEEIAYLFATIVDERNGYLTGTDILCDGGMVGCGLEKMRNNSK
jgi:NAD(P)-dependent dehydrogenase (short-subunit alcohol dehydrogenase family)